MTIYTGVVEAPINVAALGANPIAQLGAPGAGFCWRILGYFLVAAGAVQATLTSAATPKSGALPLVANTGVGPSMCDPGTQARWFSGGDNEAIGVSLSAAVQVSGQIVAIKVPAGS